MSAVKLAPGRNLTAWVHAPTHKGLKSLTHCKNETPARSGVWNPTAPSVVGAKMAKRCPCYSLPPPCFRKWALCKPTLRFGQGLKEPYIMSHLRKLRAPVRLRRLCTPTRKNTGYSPGFRWGGAPKHLRLSAVVRTHQQRLKRSKRINSGWGGGVVSRA